MVGVAEAEAAEVVEELFFTPEGRRDPHPHYHRLREVAPVYRSERLNTWLITRYAHARSVLRDPRFQRRFTDVLDENSATWRERPSLGFASRSMLMLDPPDHTRLRRRVARTFTPRRVEELRPTVRSRVDDLLDGFVNDGGGDLMEAIAFRLPVMVIGDLLGMPQKDLAQFRAPVLDLTSTFEVPISRDALDRADAAHGFCASYFRDLIADKRENPTDDLLGSLLADAGDDHLDDQELVDLLILLFVAGFETTTNLIGNAVMAFEAQPDQYEMLRREPAAVANLAEELLRLSTTIQLSNRVPTEDIEVGDVVIPTGENVFVMLGAANRDPQRYDRPDELDLRRTDIAPIAFGGGIHYCLGAALASLEIEVLFDRMAQRIDRIELVGERPVHRDRLSFWGTQSIEVRVPSTTTAPTVVAEARPSGPDVEWRRAYRARLEADPPLVEERELVARMALLEGSEFFSRCRPSELAALAATAYPLAFEPGEHLVVQGEESPDAFVVSEGTATVTIDGVPVGEVATDDLVGERGVVTATGRAATVTATSHLAAYVLSGERLEQIMGANPVAADHMREVVARYA